MIGTTQILLFKLNNSCLFHSQGQTGAPGFSGDVGEQGYTVRFMYFLVISALLTKCILFLIQSIPWCVFLQGYHGIPGNRGVPGPKVNPCYYNEEHLSRAANELVYKSLL